MARKKSSNPTIGCRVSWVTVIDHPELRGPTYPDVPAGTRFSSSKFFENCKGAEMLARELASGEWDSSGDYVRHIQVDRVRLAGSPRAYRRASDVRDREPSRKKG